MWGRSDQGLRSKLPLRELKNSQTYRSKAVVLVQFLLNVIGVGVSCSNLYSVVVYLYVNGSGSITSVREDRTNLSAVVYL